MSPEYAYSKAVEARRLLEDLRTDPGYLALNKVVQEVVDNLQHEILFSPCSSIDSAMAQEYKKGQLEGRLSWGKALDTAIENLDFDINNLKGKIEDEHERDEDTGSTDVNRAP